MIHSIPRHWKVLAISTALAVLAAVSAFQWHLASYEAEFGGPVVSKVVTNRLVILHPLQSRWNVDNFRRSRWYRKIARRGYFMPEPAVVKEIDRGLADYLEMVATSDPDADRFSGFTQGIRRIAASCDSFGGQFLGVTTTDGKKVIICAYTDLRTRPDLEFTKEFFVPWTCDGNGSNFQFYYDPATRVHTNFHIEGSIAGPFGFENFGLD